MELQVIMPRQELQLSQVSLDVRKDSAFNLPQKPLFKLKPFIEANTIDIEIQHLKQDCVIPVFSKDNEKTIYYERMAFIMRIPSITETINGNEIALTIGGVRAYNQENLYSKKTFEKFKFFIGFQNMVCCNMCVSSDGFVDDLRADSYIGMRAKLLDVLQAYQAENHLNSMKQLSQESLTEHQFAQLIGKARLYNYIPKNDKLQIPELLLNDGQISTVAKDYYQDESFCRNDNGDINLWSVYNLLTQANKSSYIDTFLDRNVNSFKFSKGLAKALNGDSSYIWFLS